MKYARSVDGVFVDPVSIPQPWPENYWTNDPVEFCEKMFPGTTGWQEVPENTGEVVVTVTPAPTVSKEDLMAKIQQLLDAVNAIQ